VVRSNRLHIVSVTVPNLTPQHPRHIDLATVRVRYLNVFNPAPERCLQINGRPVLCASALNSQIFYPDPGNKGLPVPRPRHHCARRAGTGREIVGARRLKRNRGGSFASDTERHAVTRFSVCGRIVDEPKVMSPHWDWTPHYAQYGV